MFDFEKWKNQYVVMHCKTEEEAKAFCKEMHEAGLKWWNDSPYIKDDGVTDDEWSTYKEDTCYNFNEGFYGVLEYYKNKGFIILEYSDYMNTENDMKETKEVSTRRKCLEKAIQVVCKDRNDSYGNPENNFGVMADFVTDYLHARSLLPKEKSLTDEDVAIISILFKVARRASGRYKEDTYIDIAGYAACAMEVGQRQHD